MLQRQTTEWKIGDYQPTLNTEAINPYQQLTCNLCP